jgi:hypothetical protein
MAEGKEMNLTKALVEISALFDGGASVHIDDDGICIEGFDEAAPAKGDDTVTTVYRYYASFEFDEREQQTKDVVTSLVSKIRAEQATRAINRITQEEPRQRLTTTPDDDPI